MVTTALMVPAAVGGVVKLIVSDLVVAAETVPMAPFVSVTVLFAAVGSNPNPLIVKMLASAARSTELLVTTGVTEATWTAAELLIPPVVTVAVNDPAVAGLVEKETVIEVALAEVTSPTAPLFKEMMLLATVGSNPNPLMTSVDPVAARFAVLLVTTGITVATLTAEPLPRVLVVTTAVRFPAVVGGVESVIVSEVAVAVVTVPTASLLNTTELLAATGSKPNPEIVNVVALAARLTLLVVTTGTMVATCTAEPLLMLFVVTTAVNVPAVAGKVVNVTDSVVAVAESTVPTAPLLNVTVLLAAVV